MEDQQQSRELEAVVAMVPSPGMGHFIPMIHFAKRLCRHHNLRIAFFMPTNAPPSEAQTTILTALPPLISHTFLPPVKLTDIPPNAKMETIISVTVLRSLPSLRHALLSLSATHRVTALLLDFFGTDALDLARELNAPPYLFFPSTAMVLSFALNFPRLDQDLHFRDFSKPVHIPGSTPVQRKDLGDAFEDRDDDAYKWLLHHSKRYWLAEGFVENSFRDLEPDTIDLLLREEPGRPPVYLVGPLVEEDEVNMVEGCWCLKWLDAQPHGSVILVCFGSGGTLSRDQTEELALGLEMSEERFVWVVKSPNEEVANASYFSEDNGAHPFDFLPQGFVERTKGRGLVVASWVPQAQVLRHPSIGGFVSHCGWNSILESVVNGVPLVAWPLYAEQKMNAVLVSEGMRVGVGVVSGENGVVERGEIARVVKMVMEGEEGKKLLHRIKELKEAAATALSDGGSSSTQISELALKWKAQTKSVKVK
ncbi:hydroquinone glucosyltransferase-like [Vigna unguiculata]|uniref:hydroquinone glucosyltransferase-like n=1 Tax=Vigna unguiculata TaxID=3917 RepID=UPI001015F9CD|nr:hydroquinone glucosyltransferase-like [Vigna unguiculata]